MGVDILPNVNQIMTPEVVRVNHAATIFEVAKLMDRRNIGCVIVTKDGQPVGILTERDIFRRVVARGLDATKTRAEEIMSSPLITLPPEAKVIDAADLMRRKNIRRLPILKNGTIIGIITDQDVLGALQKEYLRLTGVPEYLADE
ncbi:MAG: CBS domain-containing protein [Euryarchaeota archaeon]|nr:CBS domain-containing protein [Euryarchaeota archaeon]